MRAFEIEGETAHPCEDFGPMRRRIVSDSRPLVFPTPLSRRERRRRARAHTRGRRGARRVSPLAPLSPIRLTGAFVTDVAHHLSDGTTHVLLYLPEGIAVSDAHLRAVDRAIRATATPEAP